MLVNGPIGKREADLTLMMYLFRKMALASRGEDRSVVAFLESLTSSLGDGSVVTWSEFLKLLMVLTKEVPADAFLYTLMD